MFLNFSVQMGIDKDTLLTQPGSTFIPSVGVGELLQLSWLSWLSKDLEESRLAPFVYLWNLRKKRLKLLISVIRWGNFALFGHFFKTLFSYDLFTVGHFWGKKFCYWRQFLGQDYLLFGAFCKNLGSFSFQTSGHSAANARKLIR